MNMWTWTPVMQSKRWKEDVKRKFNWMWFLFCLRTSRANWINILLLRFSRSTPGVEFFPKNSYTVWHLVIQNLPICVIIRFTQNENIFSLKHHPLKHFQLSEEDLMHWAPPARVNHEYFTMSVLINDDKSIHSSIEVANQSITYTSFKV